MQTNLNFLSLAPFHLKPEALAWVAQTLVSLNTHQRLLQICNMAMHGDSQQEIERLKPWVQAGLGGVTRFVGADVDAAWQASAALVNEAEIPLLVSGDIEGGAIRMSCGTAFPNQLGIAAGFAASQNTELYAKVVDALALEAKALGYNWTFTPVLDINAEHRSAIVATRSFGSDPKIIETLAQINIQRFQAAGLAATAKHWPGEGYDARDQHLVTTINPLSMEDWSAQFGALYKSMIAKGVMSIMSAHIALPSFAAAEGEKDLELYRPASLSKHLNQTLLREQLGFNGVIVSDASAMGGLNAWGHRRDTVPEVIANGCDVLLFPSPVDRDLEYLHAALNDGCLSHARLEEAVIRVLGLKAALGLHSKPREQRIPSLSAARETLQNQEHSALAIEAAASSISLVKDVQKTLPLALKKHRRILLITDPDRIGFAHQTPLPIHLPDWLKSEGFELRELDPAAPPTPEDTDLVLIVLAQESLLLKQTISLDYWRLARGDLRGAMRRDWHSIPHVLVSMGHPYYLYDAPRMPCVINAYSAIEPVQRALLECLLGRAPFAGGQPVDASCGLPDARY